MKDYLIYYQHFTNSHDHWKFKLLRSLLGWSAEGRFWALNNMIARSSQCILNLNKKAIKASVMSDLQMDENEFDNFINILTNQCELLINIDGNISTDIVRENHKEVMKERIRTKERREKTIAETKPFNLIKLSTDKS
jgi:hypothetical protein